ncbi:MAG: hypothetical protein COB53_05930 [Elusimicrobia bacterium]|nr:MAG: hypothetical protein COB53_05930 [Elusimicrobiota bacterium]
MPFSAAWVGEIETRNIALPVKTIALWQEMVDILAELVGVPAALIIKASPTHMEVLSASQSEGNPYIAGARDKIAALYCETVVKTKKKLLVANALKDPKWNRNPDIKLGMISYLGYPILWPDGVPFGSICILDNKENAYGMIYQRFMVQLKSLVESHLATIHLADKLASSKSELEEANKNLESFSHSVSHDLKAPLRAIGNFAELLAEDNRSRLDDEGHRQVAGIRENTVRMSKLINDLLEFSLMARHSLTRADVDMGDLALEVYVALESAVPNNNAMVQIEDLPHTYGERTMLRQVYHNLIANALKFTGKTKNPWITIGGRRELDKNIYYVKDNGAGFDMKNAEKLFRELGRLHSQSDFKGTGIGLSIVGRIVKRHGGEVWAEGAVGEGATFNFSLPNHIMGKPYLKK